jgi:threonylcarbamoyladenosine tRNA methylthiotransferase MtaB
MAWSPTPPSSEVRALERAADRQCRAAQRHTSRFRADVQNGCDHACTFCVIPQGRGPSRSRRVAAGDRGRRPCISTAGAQEVVLTGVDLTAWGADLPNERREPNWRSRRGDPDRFPALERAALVIARRHRDR